jgi:hemerythrin
MTYMTWTPELSVGIDVIDKQHMRIVHYINELHDAMHMPPGELTRARILAVLTHAIEYTESHFGFEEAMLEDVSYTFLKAHKKVHELFIRKINDYKRRIHEGEDIAIELRDTLMRWLVNHIKSEDRDYSKWIARTATQAPQVAQARARIQEESWLGARLRRFFGAA